jgi:hypothetical protein
MRSATRFEWAAALAITAVVLLLDINYALHAGALWRDEANSYSMATYPSLVTTWNRQQFDSFPMLWYLVLRAWIKTGAGQTDGGLRLFGLLVNFAIIGMLWLNAWRMSRRPPLVGLALLGANAAVMIYCGSIRGYGLGLVLGLWMYGAVWAYVVRPTAIRWIVAALAAVLACHTLYYNCTFVAAACLAGAAVAASRRDWGVAAGTIAVGAVTAATLVIYVPVFRSSGEWRSMYVYAGGFPTLWLKFVDAIRLSHPLMPAMWVIMLLLVLLASSPPQLRRGGAARRWGGVGQQIDFLDQHHPSRGLAASTLPSSAEEGSLASYLALFAFISLAVGVIGNVLFLRLLAYYEQPWYFLCLMAVVAAAADTAARAVSCGKGFRISAVAVVAIAVVSLSSYPLYLWSTTRLTDIDEVAHALEQSAGSMDYIVVGDWTHGITFNRYYHGSAPWQTLPPLPAAAHDIHRSDLVFNLMQRRDAISSVLDSVTRTLQEGHRVFYIGPLPDGLHNPPQAVEIWRYEVAYILRRSARYSTSIAIDKSRPVSSYEDPGLSVFEGGR